jgi:hypothetical protein
VHAKQVIYRLNYTSTHFSLIILEMGVSPSICLGWPSTMFLLISASQVERIIGMSHQLLAALSFKFFITFYLHPLVEQGSFVVLILWMRPVYFECSAPLSLFIYFFFFPFFFFFSGAGDRTQGLTLARQALFH